MRERQSSERHVAKEAETQHSVERQGQPKGREEEIRKGGVGWDNSPKGRGSTGGQSCGRCSLRVHLLLWSSHDTRLCTQDSAGDALWVRDVCHGILFAERQCWLQSPGSSVCLADHLTSPWARWEARTEWSGLGWGGVEFNGIEWNGMGKTRSPILWSRPWCHKLKAKYLWNLGR